MSETHEELRQNAIDAEADGLKEYVLSNGKELYEWLFSNPSDLETIANLIVKHWNNPYMSAPLKKKINELLDEDCADKARSRIYG